jgi:YesN/AraC family two-component response regulator
MIEMKRILIIDDEEAILQMMHRLLTKANYFVVTASNGKEAEMILDKEDFDLVITDIIKPQKEGMEMITMLKVRKPDIKVIAMSGGGRFSPEGYLKSAEALGADKTFVKPFFHKDMLYAVNELIGESQ